MNNKSKLMLSGRKKFLRKVGISYRKRTYCSPSLQNISKTFRHSQSKVLRAQMFFPLLEILSFPIHRNKTCQDHTKQCKTLLEAKKTAVDKCLHIANRDPLKT